MRFAKNSKSDILPFPIIFSLLSMSSAVGREFVVKESARTREGGESYRRDMVDTPAFSGDGSVCVIGVDGLFVWLRVQRADHRGCMFIACEK